MPPPAIPSPQPDAPVRAATIPELIAQYSWDYSTALRIARCESNLNPAAYNRSGASGVFQILMPLHAWRLRPGESIFDPAVNVRIAFEMWSASGWAPWQACL